MAKRAVRSAKGEVVDFDLLRIKAQIASAPKTTNVQAREDFIDSKFKRRLKRLKREEVAKQPTVQPQVAQINVEPTLPNTDTNIKTEAQNATKTD